MYVVTNGTNSIAKHKNIQFNKKVPVSMACSQFWNASVAPSSACCQSVDHSCAELPAVHREHCHMRQNLQNIVRY